MSCIWKVSPEDRLCKYCLLTHCDERRTDKYRRHGKVIQKMRAMGVGEEIVFEYGFYNACRTAATRLRSELDACILTRAEDDGIHVVRVS